MKLNGIVERSYALINEFDRIRHLPNMPPATDATRHRTSLPTGTDDSDTLAIVRSLHARSTLALQDMQNAAHEVASSGDYYNPAVLAGMMSFVQKVDAELGSYHQAMLERL